MSDNRTYEQLVHAVQSGVKMKMTLDERDGIIVGREFEPETSPKHLRVGVNMAMVDHAALAELLISKGLIGTGEYKDSVMTVLRREVVSYEEEISARTGAKVTLG